MSRFNPFIDRRGLRFMFTVGDKRVEILLSLTLTPCGDYLIEPSELRRNERFLRAG